MKAQHSIFKMINCKFLMLLILLSVSVLIGFGCGGGSSDDGNSNDTPNDNSNGVQLSGDPASLALNATYDFDTGTGNPETEIEDDPVLGKIVRSIIEIGFSKTATIQDVNDLLDSIDGLIINMLEDVAIVIVRIPDPGSIPALETIIQDVESNPMVRFAGMGHIPDFSALPNNYTYDQTDMTMIDHNLAVRGHAAWNLRNALSSPPMIIVPDKFGMGRPVSGYGFAVTGRDFPTAAIHPSKHGYHVIGIIGATYGGPENARGWATGLYPAASPNALQLRVIDFANGISSEQIDNRLIQSIKDNLSHNIVVNTSFTFPCETQDEVRTHCVPEYAEKEALKWIEKIRDAGVEGKFVHITAAGNIYVSGDTDAKVASRYAAAKLLEGLEDCWLGDFHCTPVDNITNVLVVENQWNSTDTPYRPICLDSSSKYGGDVSGIGMDVWSLYDPAATAGNFSGTSMASPQVAALAAYVWALKPTLSNQDVINILVNTSRNAATWDPSLYAGCSAEPPAPIIDAYAAVLGVDTPSNAKVRKSLLDIANNSGVEASDGKFNEHDIELLLANMAFDQGELNYSRYDLNGDGYTGGDKLERFDLDINNPPTFTNVTQDIEGTAITFNEEGLTDMEVLCYYAYSNIFSGDADERKRLLDTKCGDTVDDECHYIEQIDASGSGSYEKDCVNRTTDSGIITIHNMVRLNSQIIKEEIIIRTYLNGSVATSTAWDNASYKTVDSFSCIALASGWIVVGASNNQTGLVESLDGSQSLWPAHYNNNISGNIFCWPGWSIWNPSDCPAYVCPGPGSIQPLHPFPGDCHQWWDHENDDGVLVTCNY